MKKLTVIFVMLFTCSIFAAEKIYSSDAAIMRDKNPSGKIAVLQCTFKNDDTGESMFTFTKGSAVITVKYKSLDEQIIKDMRSKLAEEKTYTVKFTITGASSESGYNFISGDLISVK